MTITQCGMECLVRARLAFAAAGLALLAACGGSSSSFTPPNPGSVTITAATTTVPSNPAELLPSLELPITIQLNVRVLTNTGQPIAEGTTVSMTSSNTLVGTLSVPDDPTTQNVNEFIGRFATITTQTSGGNATFFFTSGTQTGSAVLTASFQDPSANRTVTGTITITVVPAPPEERITITATRSSLPANVLNVPPFFGSPFISELTLTFRGADGTIVSPAGGTFGVAISPVTIAAFSTLDEPDTNDVNEFLVLLGNGPVDSAGGQATVFVHSFDLPGTATVTVTATDPVTNQPFSAQFPITIVAGAADGVPGQISIGQSTAPVFIQGSGGTTAKPLNIQVLDNGNQPVADPVAGSNTFNNVRVVLTPPDANGSRLTGTNAAGAAVNGLDIAVATVNGQVQVSFNSGSTTGLHRITATADRADNNVDNGIQDPLSAEATVVVGDGRLASVKLTGSVINAIQINSVSDQVDPDNPPEVDPDTGVIIPPDPDGTLTLNLSLIANDAVGNPVLPGTILQIGKVDAPTLPNDPSTFVFSGDNGNPQEGGTLFTVPALPDGFLDDPMAVDEAAGPGDTVVTFGELIPGNAELEASRSVTGVNSNTSLSVSPVYNDNNASGAIVDDGPIFPFVVGRSVIGTIVGQAQTEADGVAEFTMTYPNSAVGLPVVVWTQGNRLDGAKTQTTADAEALVFPGVAPATLTVSPGQIRGNTSADITLCVVDAINNPVRGVVITFTAAGQGNFSVSDDPLVTGPDGCVTTTATSIGLVFGQMPLVVTFMGAGATADLEVIMAQQAFLAVSPNPMNLNLTSLATATVTDDLGGVLSGVLVNLACADPGIAFTPPAATTNNNGQAFFTIARCADDINSTCTFTANVGSMMLNATISVFSSGPPPSPLPGICP